MQPPKHIFDSLLITEIKSGNKKALSILVKRWHSVFVTHANWYLKDGALAQDVAQDCWLVIIKKINSLKETNKFAPWALTIVHRKAIDQIRKNQQNHSTTSTVDVESLGATTLKDHGKVQENTDRLSLIDKGITQLPLKQRMVLELFYKNELTLDQIAEVLKISKGTVKSRLFYARESLKQQLNPRNNENESAGN